MTPNDINVLLHYYSSPTPHEHIHAPAVVESVENFCKAGILEPSPDTTWVGRYQATPLGRALVEALCRTPIPQQCFMDPRTKEILE